MLCVNNILFLLLDWNPGAGRWEDLTAECGNTTGDECGPTTGHTE